MTILAIMNQKTTPSVCPRVLMSDFIVQAQIEGGAMASADQHICFGIDLLLGKYSDELWVTSSTSSCI